MLSRTSFQTFVETVGSLDVTITNKIQSDWFWSEWVTDFISSDRQNSCLISKFMSREKNIFVHFLSSHVHVPLYLRRNCLGFRAQSISRLKTNSKFWSLNHVEFCCDEGNFNLLSIWHQKTARPVKQWRQQTVKCDRIEYIPVVCIHCMCRVQYISIKAYNTYLQPPVNFTRETDVKPCCNFFSKLSKIKRCFRYFLQMSLQLDQLL